MGRIAKFRRVGNDYKKMEKGWAGWIKRSLRRVGKDYQDMEKSWEG